MVEDRGVGTAVLMNQEEERDAASISYPALFHRWLSEQGYDAEEIFASAGVDTEWFEDPGRRISVHHFVALTREAFEATGDPALGLHFGSQLPLSAHGYLGFALQASENAEDVIRLSCTYGSTRFSGVQVELEEVRNRLELFVTSEFDDLVLHRYTLEAVVASAASSLSVLRRMNAIGGHDASGGGGDWPVLQLEFGYPQPAYHELYRDVFSNTPLAFDADATRVTFDIERLRTPFSFSNQVSRQLAVEQCQAELLALTANQGYVDKVRRLMRRDIGASHGLEPVAAQLNVSARVLSRRLSEEGANFQGLLDEVREQLAIRYLRTTNLTVSEIAHRLGYEHSNNFARAFKKWTGRSPGSYR
ncbi:MAG: AraC family transcriptional regulator [Proteobacteria bacterium]|nr:AraC family transcriptional regulator [Pseudomonadota bacterium]